MKPENLTLTSFLGLIPLIMYFLKRRTIPKLDFDGIWKEPNCKGIITCYYIRVKREKGEGEAKEVKGFVGIEDKWLKPSEWLSKQQNTVNIANHDYLILFQTFNDNGKEIILFPENIFSEFPQTYKNNLFNQYKENTLKVQIEAKKARIKERYFQKKIEDIVKESKQLPT